MRIATLGVAAAAAIGVAAWWSMQQLGGPPATSPPVAERRAEIPAHPFGFVDMPAAQTVVGPAIRLSGWALAREGIERIEVHIDGKALAARHGLPRTDVGRIHPSHPGADRGGFEFTADLGGQLEGRHAVSVIAIDRAGQSREIGRRFVLAPEPLARWKALAEARPSVASRPFYLLPGTSGIKVKGADEIRETFAPYESATLRAGMRVPILYMRTTRGRAEDWVFDPDWDFDRRCGERRIADDSLASVIDYAIAHRLPVMFTLNGGYWADASCDVPEWDINDELERDARNCQWTSRNTVPEDSAIRDLAGSQASPQLARGLTYNVYAERVRHYKRRNLQAAARRIQAFAADHPELFAGVSLDPDVYILPWFGGSEFFDYNPDTLRQFRHWLAGTGPYGARRASGEPDLSGYRRPRTYTLAEVGKLAGRRFASWDDVDPPRTFPPTGVPARQHEWNAPWRLVWDQFRRHLVQVHYTELAAWTIEAGIAPDKVYTAQAFVSPDPGLLPQPVMLDSATTDYDSAGVSIEGAIPRQGRLGAILYGENATNDARMQTGESMFRILQRLAGEWGAVEFSTARLKDHAYRPTYADGYRAFREIANFGATLISPMAWNGWNGLYVNEPGYRAYTSWRNTPAEAAAFDTMLERANVPIAAKLWTFGSVVHADSDGWTIAGAGTIASRPGRIEVVAARGLAALDSPPGDYVRADRYDLVVLGASRPDGIASVRILGRRDGSRQWLPLTGRLAASTLERSAAGLSIPLAWPTATFAVDRLRIEIASSDPAAPLRLDHIALYPRAASR